MTLFRDALDGQHKEEISNKPNSNGRRAQPHSSQLRDYALMINY